MTLAAIFLVSIFCASAAPPLMAAGHQTTQQAAPEAKPPEPAATPDPGTAPAAQNPPTSSQATPSPATPAKTSAGQTRSATTAKRPHHKKKVLPPNCDNAPATGQAAPGSSPAAADPAAGSAPKAAASNPATNCPPSKVIVRQGGTAEPSIQLAGGTAGNQTSHERDTANQMLESTDANLKKIAGRQLTSNQQDMVSQIRQFMDQSKAAITAGDLERARTLAWKAQLLSEELVKPEK